MLHTIQIKISHETRKRAEMIRTVLTMLGHNGKVADWHDVFSFAIDQSPVEKWMQEIIDGAKKEEESTDGQQPDGTIPDEAERTSEAPDGGQPAESASVDAQDGLGNVNADKQGRDGHKPARRRRGRKNHD